MINYRQATVAYRHTGSAVPPMAALLRLYDDMVASLATAARAIEARDHETAFTKVERVSIVLRGLDHALDFESGGEIAEMLHNIYTRYIFVIHLSYGRPDCARRYAKLLEGLKELRAAWVDVAINVR